MAAYGDSNTVLASVSRVIGQNSAIFARGVFLWFCQVISLGSLPVFDNADAGPLGPAFFYSRQLVRLRKGPCPS